MKLKIKSEDMYGEKYNETFAARVETTPKGRKYTYKDNDTDVTMYVYDGKVRIARKGSINSKQVFDAGTETKFRYITNYLQTDLTLVTKELIIKSNSVKLHYELYNDGMLVNKIKMSINEG
jgi:uncharacterized beta-barrel protein YwiB (DUF1934 family)